MPFLRRLPRLARLVLAVWLLSLGAAIASPAVQPQRLEMICAGGVMTLVVQDDGQAGTTAPSLDCPLCVALGAPLPTHDAGVRATPAPLARAPLATWPPLTRPAAERPPVRGPPAVTPLV